MNTAVSFVIGFLFAVVAVGDSLETKFSQHRPIDFGSGAWSCEKVE